ncbi:MAG: hypothetical protein U0736_21110 [Gemmataceae bacterium]
MSGRRQPALERFLFWLGIALAATLLAGVIAAPLVDTGAPAAAGWRRVVALFARDATLRRTCFASAAGLAVSACVFFQPSRRPTAAAPPDRRPRWPGVAGA